MTGKPVGSFYVYVYSDPRCGTPFYVGKGKDFRAWVHLRRRGPNRILSNKIAQIRNAGFEPTVEIIATAFEAAAFELERALIAVIGRRDQGFGPLLNYTAGGEGSSGRDWFRHSPESRAKIGDAIRGKRRNADTRQRMREGAARRYARPGEKEKLDAARVKRHAK